MDRLSCRTAVASGRGRSSPSSPLAVLRPVASAPRPRPIVSQATYEAGQWARANLPPGCVDYFTADSNAAYWLHVAVLGNLRESARTRE